MVTPELASFVKAQIDAGVSAEVITSQLLAHGWNAEDIHEALGHTAPTVVHYSHSGSGRGKKLSLVVAIIILILVGGGAAYGYYSGYFVSLPKLTAEAVDSARAAKTAQYDVTVTVDVSAIKDSAAGLSQIFSGAGSRQFVVTLKGAYDNSDPKSIKDSTAISISAGTFSIGADVMNVDHAIYARLTKAPTLAMLPMFSQYENKWYSYSYKGSEDGSANNGAPNPVSSYLGVTSDITSKLTPAQQEHIYQMSRDAHFIKTVKKFAPEEIGGVTSYHFAFDIDREGITAYLQSLKDYVRTVGKDDSALSAFDPTSFSKTFDTIKNFQGELWLGRSDKLVHKVTMSFGVLPDEQKPDELVKASLVGIFSGWDQPVTIVAPTESTPFQDLISGVVGGSLDSAREKGNDAKIKAGLSNLRAQAEIFYDAHGSYAGVCSSPEYITIRKDIETVKGAKFSCKDMGTQHRASVNLSTGDYWCIDNTGFSKNVAKAPSGVQCQ